MDVHDAIPLIAEEEPVCPNCLAPAEGGRFCAACGQPQRAFQQPVHVLAKDLLAEYFGFEGKLWRTARALLRPGFLTAEYLAGRQRRYARPLRLYLTASLVLFFTVSLLDPGEQLRREILKLSGSASVEEALAETQADLDRLERRQASLRALQAAGVEAIPDSLAGGQAAPDSSGRFTVFGREVESRTLDRIVNAESAAEVADEVPRVLRDSIARIPNAMFVLLPAFAFLLKLLYARRKRYYGEHLVFAFHVHTFWFACFTLVLILGTLLGDVPGVALQRGGEEVVQAARWQERVSDLLGLLAFVGLPAYTVLAMRRVYGQGWGKTLVKAAALLWGYVAVLVVGLVVVVLVTLIG